MAGDGSGGGGKLRFVRCPKCKKILVEHAAVPVYRCGGCGAVLRAKEGKVESSKDEMMVSSHEDLIEELERSLSEGEIPQPRRRDELDDDDDLDSPSMSRSLAAQSERLKTSSGSHHDHLIEELEMSLRLSEAEDSRQLAVVEEDGARISPAVLDSSLGRCHSALPAAFDGLNDEFTDTIRRRHGRSLDSHEFTSMQKTMGSRPGRSSSSRSLSSSGGESEQSKNIVRVERLKKMQELRSQLSRKPSDQRSRPRGVGRPPRSHTFNFKQTIGKTIAQFGSFRARSPSPPPPPPPPPPPLEITFLPPSDNSCIASECGFCCQSSLPETPREIDAMSQHLSFKSRPAVRKALMRPVSSAAPFLICSGCLELLQMPSDFHVSRRRTNRLQCGKCGRHVELTVSTASTIDRRKTGGEIAADPGHSGMTGSALHRLMGYSTASGILKSRMFEVGTAVPGRW